MNKTFKFLAASLIAGATTVAVAQTPKASLADTFARMQAESSNSSQFQPTQPIFSNRPADPAARLSLAEMQALSSESPVWQLDRGRAQVDPGPTFAQIPPQGLSFGDYQALASNSGAFSASANADTAMASNDGSRLRRVQWPIVRERIASFFHRDSASPTEAN